MTQPGYVAPPAPGWWVRTNRVGLAATQYRWDVAVAGARASIGDTGGAYGWAGTATGESPFTLPSFDAVGAGFVGLTFGADHDYSHTATAGAYVVAALASDIAATVTTMNYNGAAMTLLGTYTMSGGNSGNAWLKLYGKAGVAGGTKTVRCNISSGGWCCVNTVSYNNVTAVGTPVGTGGTGVDPSQAITPGAKQIVVGALGAVTSGSFSGAFASVSGGSTRANPTGNDVNMAILDTATNTTFSADATGSGWWGAINVALTGII